jgi:hypothetical protein
MCGGSAPSGVTRYDWNESMAPYWNGPQAGVLERSRQMRDRPYEQYGGQRIAGLSADQTAAASGIRNFALNSGNDATIAANGQTYQTLSGDYLSGNKQDPLAAAANVFGGGANAAPYKAMKQAGMDDITQAYMTATAPDTQTSAVQAGVFGGGDHGRAVEKNQQALARNLSRYGAEMDNTQYDRSANSEEARINRGSGAWQAERGRQMGAIGAGQNEQALQFDRMRQLMGVGDIYRSLSQDNLNLGYQDWQDSQNWGQKQMDWFTNILSRAQGGVSPTAISNQPGYAANPFSSVLGAGLLGYGLTR